MGFEEEVCTATFFCNWECQLQRAGTYGQIFF